MRHFIVTVHPMRVQIDEGIAELKAYDYSALVDGEIWRYKIEKHKSIARLNKTWRARAAQTIHYHAHNSGEVVVFQPVYSRRVKKRKHYEKKLSLW